MKALVLVAAIFAASPVSAEPNKLSQHPRVGELARLDFPRGSDRLSRDYNDEIGEIAGWAVDHPAGLVVIDGFTAPGEKAPANNALLAEKRANAVRDRLRSLGVDPYRIVVAAFASRGAPRVVVWGTHENVDQVATRLDNQHAAVVERPPLEVVAGR